MPLVLTHSKRHTHRYRSEATQHQDTAGYNVNSIWILQRL